MSILESFFFRCCGGSGDRTSIDKNGPYIKSYDALRRANVNVDDEIEVETRAPKVEVQTHARKVLGFPTYSCAIGQPLRGIPVREGELWHLCSQDNFRVVCFSLYINGVSFANAMNQETSLTLSPFSVIRTCRFESGPCAQLRSFKVTPNVSSEETCYYFAVRSSDEHECELERSSWVLSMSHSISLITDSLLPPFSTTCDPLNHSRLTERRLMAGYLIHKDSVDSISVLYCELNASIGDSASFVFYENELCTKPIRDIAINNSSLVGDVVGINCSCFYINEHYFAAQTPMERKLWLRALTNMKVKLQNEAPTASEEELSYYRESIREHILVVEAMLEPRVVSDPLLALEEPKKSPFGTVFDEECRPASIPQIEPSCPERLSRNSTAFSL